MTAERHASVIVASTRAAATIYEDRSGPIAVERLRALGFVVADALVVSDGDGVGAAIRDAVAAGVDVVLTSGGTGLSSDDQTPEQTAAIIDREVPGISAAIREAGSRQTATAALSRGIAGLAGRTLIVNLPGSPGGVRDGMDVLATLLGHAVDQVRGGGHG